MTKTDLVETYGEDGVPTATIRLINPEAPEASSSMVTLIASTSARKRMYSATTTPICRQPIDDDSVDGGEDAEMKLDEVTSIQLAPTHDERPGGHEQNGLDPDLTSCTGPGIRKLLLNLLTRYLIMQDNLIS